MGNRSLIQKRIDRALILEKIEASDIPMTAFAVSDGTNMSYNYTRKVLKRLAKEGKIREFSRYTVTYYFKQ